METQDDGRDVLTVGQWGRVNCSMLNGLFGPIGEFRGGQDSEAKLDGDETGWESDVNSLLETNRWRGIR